MLLFIRVRNRWAIRDRFVGTTVGAIAARGIAAFASGIVCLILAAICAVLTVSYGLTPGGNLRRIVFLTPTVLLLSGAFKFGLDVVVLGAERILLTLAAALLAAVFTLIIARPLPVDEAG